MLRRVAVSMSCKKSLCAQCIYVNDLLSMLAVFSVVISISGSVKYSDATHLPFSGPERDEN